MAKWLQFNLKLGKTEAAGVQLLDQKLMEEMHWAAVGFENQNVLQERFLTRPQYPVDAIQIGYGYGWFVSTYRGTVCVPQYTKTNKAVKYKYFIFDK